METNSIETIEEQAERLNRKELSDYKVKEIASLLKEIETEKTEHESKMKNLSERIEYIKNMKRVPCAYVDGVYFYQSSSSGVCMNNVVSPLVNRHQ